MLPLPTDLAARRARFLRSLSWFSLVRRRSERIYQLGLGGLIMAPLVGWIVLHFVNSPAHVFPRQLGALYFSGLFYVLATALLLWRCPTLIKELCLRPTDSNPDRDKHLAALIEEEILNLQTVRLYPVSAAKLAPSTVNSEIAAAMYASKIPPMMNGFGSYGRYLLERAILEFAAKSQFKIFEDTGARSPQLRLVDGASKVFEARTPYVVGLIIRQPWPDEILSSDDIADQTGKVSDDGAPRPSKNDLILQWHDVGIETPDSAGKDVILEIKHAHGLRLLYEKGNLEEFAWIITRWQNWRRLPSRLIIWTLYSLAISLFAVFLVMQTITVWDAMELSNLILGVS